MCSRSPIAPITVTSSPLERWARAPTDSIRSTTECTCSSVASDFITIIIRVPSSLLRLRERYELGPDVEQVRSG
jgi:hypothetical protein